jgi:hypothetical protein
VDYCREGVDINRAVIAAGAALACPRGDVRYMPDELPEALAAQPRATLGLQIDQQGLLYLLLNFNDFP